MIVSYEQLLKDFEATGLVFSSSDPVYPIVPTPNGWMGFVTNNYMQTDPFTFRSPQGFTVEFEYISMRSNSKLDFYPWAEGTADGDQY